MRQVLNAQLKRMNVTVTQAVDGEAALGLITAPGQFDVAILDNIMPGRINGLDLARRIREIDAGIGIILQSGDSSALEDGEAAVDFVDEFFALRGVFLDGAEKDVAGARQFGHLVVLAVLFEPGARFLL